MPWDAMAEEAIEAAVFAALAKNRDYERGAVLGLPGSTLDRRVFPRLEQLRGFPLLRTLVANPNHIGCHTLGSSESAFEGTQGLEREALRICAEELLSAEPGSWDGYVASGGTEANIQALWTFRNRWRDQRGVPARCCGVLCSADTHYSIAKGSDLLGLSLWQVPVDDETRGMSSSVVAELLARAIEAGVTHMIVVLNMGTTMFGSIDDPERVLPALVDAGLEFTVHVDAAFGGFIYPLLADRNALDFGDPRVESVTLDAHKMLQAPYGTGIHLVRKGLIGHVMTGAATYVPGLDCTLSGSRSGMNAVAVWMILQAHGSVGGARACRELVERAARLCAGLDRLGVRYFRHPLMNVVAMRAEDLPADAARRWLLVPDTHEGPPTWLKIVVMEHVSHARLEAFLLELEAAAS